MIFVASLKSLWPSSSLSLSHHYCPHWLHCDPGGYRRGGNKLRGAIISPLLLLLFLTWQSICEGHKAWALFPASVPPCQYLWQTHKHGADSQSILCFLCVHLFRCDADKFDSFRLKERLRCLIPAQTHRAALTQSALHMQSIALGQNNDQRSVNPIIYMQIFIENHTGFSFSHFSFMLTPLLCSPLFIFPFSAPSLPLTLILSP